MNKKILHVLSSNDLAGAENVAIGNIELSREQYECAYASPKGDIQNILQDRGILYIGMDKLSIFQLKSVIKTFQPDILHAHDFKATIICLFSTWKIPVISHVHQNPFWLRKINLYSIFFFLACLKLRNILVVSPVIKEETFLASFFNQKTIILQNIVQINEIRIKAKEQVDDNVYDLIFLGRYEEIKNPVRFIDIVSKVVQRYPSLKVAMLGGGSLETQCREMIEREKLQNTIDFRLFENNPYPFLYKSKLFVLTSKSEGLPMVLMEALALEKPVITSHLPELKNIVQEEFGILCITDDEFVESILSLIEDRDLYISMSKAAYKRALELCNQENYMNSLHRVYSSAT